MDAKYEFYLEKLKLNIKNILNKFYKNKNLELMSIKSKNREYLQSIPYFITQDIYATNDYGIPPGIYKNINKLIDNSETYTDLLAFLIDNLFGKSINYLETGVSILKNYLQLDNFLENSKMFAYEIEDVNPLFADLFTTRDRMKIHQGKNTLNYFKGDLMNKSDNNYFNDKLDNINFDVIFSDAHHQHWSLIWEYKKILKPNLSDNFLIYFDDAHFPNMEDAILDIKADLEYKYTKVYGVSYFVNGWVGQYEKMHKNIVLSTFDVHKLLIKEKIKLVKLKKL